MQYTNSYWKSLVPLFNDSSLGWVGFSGVGLDEPFEYGQREITASANVSSISRVLGDLAPVKSIELIVGFVFKANMIDLANTIDITGDVIVKVNGVIMGGAELLDDLPLQFKQIDWNYIKVSLNKDLSLLNGVIRKEAFPVLFSNNVIWKNNTKVHSFENLINDKFDYLIDVEFTQEANPDIFISLRTLMRVKRINVVSEAVKAFQSGEVNIDGVLDSNQKLALDSLIESQLAGKTPPTYELKFEAQKDSIKTKLTGLTIIDVNDNPVDVNALNQELACLVDKKTLEQMFQIFN